MMATSLMTILVCLLSLESFSSVNFVMADQPESVKFSKTPVRSNHVSLVRQDNNLSITTTGIDPFLVWEWSKPLQLIETSVVL